MRRAVATIVVACSVLASFVSRAAKDELAEVRAKDEAFAAAFSARDAGALVDYYAEDAVLMDPGPAMWIRGREAIRRVYEDFFAGIDDVKFTIHDATYRVSGKVAYTWSLWDLTYRDVKTGATQIARGRGTSVFERRGGKWVAVIDHASLPLPAGAPE